VWWWCIHFAGWLVAVLCPSLRRRDEVVFLTSSVFALFTSVRVHSHCCCLSLSLTWTIGAKVPLMLVAVCVGSR
jgi:hypothetical protein